MLTEINMRQKSFKQLVIEIYNKTVLFCHCCRFEICSNKIEMEIVDLIRLKSRKEYE